MQDGLAAFRKWLSTGVFHIFTVEKDGGKAVLFTYAGLSSDWRIGEGW